MKIGQKLYNHISPATIELSPRLTILLNKMYPSINWKEVPCYDGIPWFMAKSFAIGTALPSGFFNKKRGMYFRDFREMSSHQSKTILVHEAYHIQQYHDLNSSLGWGFNCVFMHYYFGWNFEYFFTALFSKKMTWKEAQYYAYRQHPMEVPAYDHEATFSKVLAHFNAHEVGTFLHQFPSLKIKKAQITHRPKLPFYILGIITSISIAISRPIIESILLGIAILLGGRKQKPTLSY